MDRLSHQDISQSIAALDERIVQGECRLTTQRGRVATLEHAGEDSSASRDLLHYIEEGLALRYQLRARLLWKLRG